MKRVSPLIWEIGAGCVVAFMAMALSHYGHVFERFIVLNGAHEAYLLDEFFVLFVVSTVMLAIFLGRRFKVFRIDVARGAASEARFAGLFAASPYPVGVFSLSDGSVIDANVTALRAARMSRDDIIGRPMRDLPFWEPAAADELLRRVREERFVRNMEIATRGAPGERRPVLISAQTVELDGKPCFVAAMSDITELRAAEHAHAASDAELRGVFRAMSDIVLVLSRDGEYLKVPTTNAPRLYRASETMLGKRVHDVLPAAAADSVCATIRQSLAEQRAVTFEYMLRFDEHDVWFSAVVTPLTHDSVVWVARDITDEREMRRSLGESEAHYKLLFDRNPQPMFVLDDADRSFLDVNDAAVRHYGYSREEFLSMTAADIRPPEEVARFQAESEGVWPVASRRVFRHRKRNGDVIDVEISRDSISYHGRPARLVLAHDVTDPLRVSRELERSLSLQRATLDATADGIIALDRSGHFTSWNGKFAELWNLPAGITDPSVVERAFATAFAKTKHPDASAAAREKALAANPNSTYFELLEFTDGRVVERYSQPRRVGEEVVGRVSSFRDVTQRERAIAQRKMLSDRFESAFGDAPIGMAIIAPGGRWIQVNTAMCELLGRGSEELLSKTSEYLTHPDDRELRRALIGKLLSGEVRTARAEQRFVHSSGRNIWAHVNATMLSRGESSGFMVLHVLDVTERRAAEESLRRQALVFETTSEVVVVCGADGRIIDVNQAAKTIFGYEREELIGQAPQIWQRKDVSPPVHQTISEALRATGAWSGEYGFVAKDGHTGIVETTIKALCDADGNPINTIGVIRDVTERRELELNLRQAQKLEAIGSLAAGIAHEINTPMQYVGDNVSFLGENIGAFGEVVEKARALADAVRARPDFAADVAAFDHAMVDVDIEYLMTEMPVAAADSQEGCERISEIVSAMKGFAHPGGSQKELVDLNAAVGNTIIVCRNEWKYVATMATQLDKTLPLVPGLAGELQQVVLNLIVNAAHAIAEARAGAGELGHITISTRQDENWAEIRVQDDGCGVPDSIRGKIFDPFFTTKKVGSGTGQGLSICHAMVVRTHQGTLTFESAEGHGTTFIIRLPLRATGELTEAA